MERGGCKFRHHVVLNKARCWSFPKSLLRRFQDQKFHEVDYCLRKILDKYNIS